MKAASNDGGGFFFEKTSTYNQAYFSHMGQSLVQNYIHIVFATKHRRPIIQPPVEGALHAYMAGICMEMGCPALIIGGYTDHVHILCRLSQKLPLMKLLQVLKCNSSRWIKSQGESYHDFGWQNGYGAFSVDNRGVEIVRAYIANQHRRHGKQSFKREYLDLLRENELEFDGRYVWD